MDQLTTFRGRLLASINARGIAGTWYTRLDNYSRLCSLAQERALVEGIEFDHAFFGLVRLCITIHRGGKGTVTADGVRFSDIQVGQRWSQILDIQEQQSLRTWRKHTVPIEDEAIMDMMAQHAEEAAEYNEQARIEAEATLYAIAADMALLLGDKCVQRIKQIGGTGADRVFVASVRTRLRGAGYDKLSMSAKELQEFFTRYAA